MLKPILTFSSSIVLIIHIGILYFWIFAWEKLVTPIGIICWLTSIVAGIVLYTAYRKYDAPGKLSMLSRRSVLSSTLFTIVLAAFAIIIEYITASMT